jgi:hypothetical protein
MEVLVALLALLIFLGVVLGGAMLVSWIVVKIIEFFIGKHDAPAPDLDPPSALPTHRSIFAEPRPPAALPIKQAPRATDRTCPYCKDSLDERSVHIECATCSAWHHATCFEENQGCAVFGCKERRGRGVAGERPRE